MGLRTAALALVGANLTGPAVVSSPTVGTYSAAVSAANKRAAEAERRLERERRISGAGTRITAGAIASLEHNEELKGWRWRGRPGTVGIATKMLRDPHVRQSLSYVYAPLLAATWRFRPASDSPLDREAAAFAQWCFVEQLNWHEIIKRTVADYCAYGFALAELTDESLPVPEGRFPLHRGGGFGIVPTDAHQIPAWTVDRWGQSKSAPSRVASVTQYVQGSDGEEIGYRTIPADRVVRWTWDQEGANFEGSPILRSAYAPWRMKNAFQTIWAMKHERLGMPAPVAIASETATDDDIDEVENVLKEMRANSRGYAVLDNGWTFKWEGSGDSNASNLELAIQICNQDIAYNVSAGFMLLGLTGKSGSYALGATQQGQYHLAELAQARFLLSGWNLGYDDWSPVERIIRLNYGDDVGLPTLEARNLPTSPWSERIPLAINAANVGLITPDAKTEDAIREMLEFDPHDASTARPRGGAQTSTALMPTARDKQPDKVAPDDAEEERHA